MQGRGWPEHGLFYYGVDSKITVRSRKNFDNYRITRLENGIKVISEEIPHFRSISLGFWVPAGSRDENEHNNGITHLIEHLIFKGTKNRTFRDIAIEFDVMGAEFNAFTDKEYCCIYADFIDDNLQKCMELLLDIICNPSFHQEHIETEKNVILEEISMMEDNPSEMLLHHLYSGVFRGHPLQLPILGSRKSLADIDRDSIIDYFYSKFRLNDMIISAAGNIMHGKLVDLVKRYPVLAEKKDSLPGIRDFSVPENGSRQSIHSSSHRAVHMSMGGTGCDRSHEDRYPLSLFTNLLGGSMSSRLFQRIREEEGLSYSISASNIQYRDTGLVMIYSASSPGNVKKILRLIRQELDDIRKSGVRAEELERARQNMKGNIVLAVEDISSRMFRLGKTLLFDKKVLTIDQILKKIDSITVYDINNIARKYFDPENLQTIILGKDTEGMT